MQGNQNAIADLWPKVDRRYCCKHLSKNFKRKFPGPLILSLFWKACGAYSFFTFEKAMKQLHKANPLSLVWLSKIEEQSTWSKHAFQPRVKSDVNKSNFVESFNATLGIDRCRPVLTLLEGRTLELSLLLFFQNLPMMSNDTIVLFCRCEKSDNGENGHQEASL